VYTFLNIVAKVSPKPLAKPSALPLGSGDVADGLPTDGRTTDEVEPRSGRTG
jgi:hypothetical protein